ncbi:hypothetical protein AFE_2909 [Acidithiobacillus ferrooxidans ATCC 23270]|uniref:Uncharacterized protein n=1 Tax=Acidithiobacillus ferrooxidans (strain ATCC 23270 / DSM 14882 / CIP 104768 / NCIMB 8455) TaxID=243159 RepID=B7J9A1_ACIF2|nr:hypothetical protein AFE_2909 [Acidithiobacillus ferrooxidans ATCC 23270]
MVRSIHRATVEPVLPVKKSPRVRAGYRERSKRGPLALFAMARGL